MGGFAMQLNAIDPRIPDPVESRRAASGFAVRFAYGLGIIVLAATLLWHFGRGFLFLEGTGVVSAPVHDISTPYLSRVEYVNVVPGIVVTAGDLLARIKSPQLDREINEIERALVEQSQKEADLRVRFRMAKATSQSASDRLAMANEAYQRLDGKNSEAASLGYRMDVYRERSQAMAQKAQAEAEIDEIQAQLDRFELNRRFLKGKIAALEADFDDGKIIAPIGGLIGNTIAHTGEIIKPGDTIAEIYDLSEFYIVWHIPAFGIKQPKIADPVFIHYGPKVLPGYIFEIKQIAEAAAEPSQSVLREKQPQQIIIVKTIAKQPDLPIHAAVTVRMNYSSWLDALIGRLLGLVQ